MVEWLWLSGYWVMWLAVLSALAVAFHKVRRNGFYYLLAGLYDFNRLSPPLITSNYITTKYKVKTPYDVL